jgi:hypothetical protein
VVYSLFAGCSGGEKQRGTQEMRTIGARVIRDRVKEGEVVRWLFGWIPGLEKWGTMTPGGLVRIDGKEIGLIAMDWIRDQGHEVEIQR